MSMRAPSRLPFLFKTGATRMGSPFRSRSQGPVRLIALSLLPLVVLFVVLFWWWQAFRSIETSGAGVRYLAEVSITLAPEQSLIVGRAELGQPPGLDMAEARHVEITRSRDGGLTLRNVARRKRLLLRFHDGTRRLATQWELTAGRSFEVKAGAAWIRFSSIAQSGLNLTVSRGGTDQDARRYHLSLGIGGPRLVRLDGDEPRLDICRTAGELEWLGHVLGKILPAPSASEHRVLELGGYNDCYDGLVPQVGMAPALQWRALSLIRRDGAFFLVPGRGAERDRLDIELVGMRRGRGFSDIAWRVDENSGLHSIIVGRTGYRVFSAVDGGTLRLVPTEKVPFFDADGCDKRGGTNGCAAPVVRTGVVQKWSEVSSPLADTGATALLRTLGPAEQAVRAGMIIIPLLLALTIWRLPHWLAPVPATSIRRRRSAPSGIWRWPLALCVVSVLLALAPELSLAADVPLTANQAMAVLAIAWFVAGVSMVLADAPLLALVLWILVAVLAAIGSSTLAAMAVDGPHTGWANHFIKNKYLFLDILPPFIVASMTVPLRSLRPIFQELVTGARPGYWVARWGVAALMIVPILVWIVAGNQHGLAGFQPVEIGKFAAILITASLLLGMERSVHRSGAGRNLWRQFFSFAILCLFLGLVVFSPVLKRDMSPVLILIALLLFLLGAYILPIGWSAISAALRHRIEYRRLPLTFRPPYRGRGTWFLAGVFLMSVGVAAAINLPLQSMAMRTFLEVEHWPEDRDGRIENLKNALVDAYREDRRLIPAQRWLAYLDLSLETVDQPKPTARYRDLGYQIIRSRVAVAHAQCGSGEPAIGTPLLRDTTVSWALGGILAAAADALALSSYRSGLCETGSGRDEPGVSRLKSGVQRVMNPRPPIEIPAVQDDFAAAFLLSRFGIAAGLTLGLAQIGFVAAAVMVVMLVGKSRDGQHVDDGVRRFLSVATAGAVTLFVLHWTISWSNILGLIPVMGQPMTLLSSATSHHLFMSLPCIVVLLIGARFAMFSSASIAWHAPPYR